MAPGTALDLALEGQACLPQPLAGRAMSLGHRGLYSEKTRVAFPLFCALGVTQLN